MKSTLAVAVILLPLLGCDPKVEPVPNQTAPAVRITEVTNRFFSIGRKGKALEITLTNPTSEPLVYSTYVSRWEPVIFDSLGRKISDSGAYYAKVEMRAESKSDWKTLQPKQMVHFTLSSHDAKGDMSLSGFQGYAEVEYQGSAPDHTDASPLPSLRAVYRLN